MTLFVNSVLFNTCLCLLYKPYIWTPPVCFCTRTKANLKYSLSRLKLLLEVILFISNVLYVVSPAACGGTNPSFLKHRMYNYYMHWFGSQWQTACSFVEVWERIALSGNPFDKLINFFCCSASVIFIETAPLAHCILHAFSRMHNLYCRWNWKPGACSIS